MARPGYQRIDEARPTAWWRDWLLALGLSAGAFAIGACGSDNGERANGIEREWFTETSPSGQTVECLWPVVDAFETPPGGVWCMEVQR